MDERDSASRSGVVRDPGWFSDTLSERDRVRLRHALSAPLGLAAHGLALGALVLMSMLAVPEQLEPKPPRTTLLQFAPPPPPTPARGDTLDAMPRAATSEAGIVTFEPSPSFVIPDELLAPVLPVDWSYGYETGFDDGEANGMAGGMPGGVVGGVPGGLVGGAIGGTGTAIPDLPTPDVMPRPIRMPPASYTEEAIREKVRGSVKLRVVIDQRGNVEVLEVLQSIPELDAAAIETVESRWRFEPATKNGRPIACLSDLVVRFNLY